MNVKMERNNCYKGSNADMIPPSSFAKQHGDHFMNENINFVMPIKETIYSNKNEESSEQRGLSNKQTMTKGSEGNQMNHNAKIMNPMNRNNPMLSMKNRAGIQKKMGGITMKKIGTQKNFAKNKNINFNNNGINNNNNNNNNTINNNNKSFKNKMMVFNNNNNNEDIIEDVNHETENEEKGILREEGKYNDKRNTYMNSNMNNEPNGLFKNIITHEPEIKKPYNTMMINNQKQGRNMNMMKNDVNNTGRKIKFDNFQKNTTGKKNFKSFNELPHKKIYINQSNNIEEINGTKNHEHMQNVSSSSMISGEGIEEEGKNGMNRFKGNMNISMNRNKHENTNRNVMRNPVYRTNQTNRGNMNKRNFNNSTMEEKQYMNIYNNTNTHIKDDHYTYNNIRTMNIVNHTNEEGNNGRYENKSNGNSANLNYVMQNFNWDLLNTPRKDSTHVETIYDTDMNYMYNSNHPTEMQGEPFEDLIESLSEVSEISDESSYDLKDKDPFSKQGNIGINDETERFEEYSGYYNQFENNEINGNSTMNRIHITNDMYLGKSSEESMNAHDFNPRRKMIYKEGIETRPLNLSMSSSSSTEPEQKKRKKEPTSENGRENSQFVELLHLVDKNVKSGMEEATYSHDDHVGDSKESIESEIESDEQDEDEEEEGPVSDSNEEPVEEIPKSFNITNNDEIKEEIKIEDLFINSYMPFPPEKYSNIYELHEIKILSPHILKTKFEKGNKTYHSALKDGKLLLLLDLDNTLLQAISHPKLNMDLPLENFVDDNGEAQLYKFHLPSYNFYYFLKFRPYVRQFLHILSLYYELSVYTNATREYADVVIAILDPDRTLFSDRIVARCSALERDENKHFARIYPNIDSRYVIAFDDRTDVWVDIPQSHVLKAEHYNFFELSKYDIMSHFKEASTCRKKFLDLDMHLHYMTKVLLKLHKRFFENPLEVDVGQLIKQIMSEALQNAGLYFTGFRKNSKNLQNVLSADCEERQKEMALELGAKIYSNFNKPGVTHIIAAKNCTDNLIKSKQKNYDHIKKVHTLWLYHCRGTLENANCDNFDVDELCTLYNNKPPLHPKKDHWFFGCKQMRKQEDMEDCTKMENIKSRIFLGTGDYTHDATISSPFETIHIKWMEKEVKLRQNYNVSFNTNTSTGTIEDGNPNDNSANKSNNVYPLNNVTSTNITTSNLQEEGYLMHDGNYEGEFKELSHGIQRNNNGNIHLDPMSEVPEEDYYFYQNDEEQNKIQDNIQIHRNKQNAVQDENREKKKDLDGNETETFNQVTNNGLSSFLF